MRTYYMSFAQKSNNKNHWLEIQALSYSAAFDYAKERYADSWSNLYEPEEWNPQYFPAGCLRVETVSDAKGVGE